MNKRIWIRSYNSSVNTSSPTELEAWSCQALEQMPQRLEYVSVDTVRALKARLIEARQVIEAAATYAPLIDSYKLKDYFERTLVPHLHKMKARESK